MREACEIEAAHALIGALEREGVPWLHVDARRHAAIILDQILDSPACRAELLEALTEVVEGSTGWYEHRLTNDEPLRPARPLLVAYDPKGPIMPLYDTSEGPETSHDDPPCGRCGRPRSDLSHKPGGVGRADHCWVPAHDPGRTVDLRQTGGAIDMDELRAALNRDPSTWESHRSAGFAVKASCVGYDDDWPAHPLADLFDAGTFEFCGRCCCGAPLPPQSCWGENGMTVTCRKCGRSYYDEDDFVEIYDPVPARLKSKYPPEGIEQSARHGAHLASRRLEGTDAWDREVSHLTVSNAVSIAFNPPDEDAAESDILARSIEAAAFFIEGQPCRCHDTEPDNYGDPMPCDRCRVLGRLHDYVVER